MKRLLLTVVLASSACVPAPARGPVPATTPEAAYRDYWAAAPDLSDAEALAPFITADQLAAYREARGEGEERLVLAARRQRARFEQLRIESVEVPWMATDSATLSVRLVPTDDATEFTAPETGMVAMIREGGRWRIHFESSDNDGDTNQASARDAPACGSVVGIAGAANVLHVRSGEGEREVRFPDAVLLVEDDRIRLQLPRFGAGNEYEVVAEDVSAAWGVHDVQLLGQFVATAHLPLPAFAPGERKGTMAVEQVRQSDDGARFKTTFAIPQSDDPELGFFGEVEGAVVDLRTVSLASGSIAVINGTQEAATRGRLRHQPELSLLEIQLGTRNRMPARLIQLPAFRATPGVYAAEACAGATCEPIPADRKLLVIVEDFQAGRIRAEVREVPAEELSEELPTRDAAARIGTLAARFESGNVVVVPTLDAIPDTGAPCP